MKSVVFNIDCMLGMRDTPDNYYDLAVADPPYGINISEDLHKRGESCQKNGYRKWDYKEWDNKPPSKGYFIELFRVSKKQIIWGGNYFDLPPTRCWLIWNKMQRDFSFADGELAWTSFDSSVRIFDYARGKALNNANLTKIHPTQKPIRLYEWILKNYAEEGQKILDTHLGSGSSRIAGYNYKMDFTGYELDKDYFDAAEKRFQNHISQLKMFP